MNLVLYSTWAMHGWNKNTNRVYKHGTGNQWHHTGYIVIYDVQNNVDACNNPGFCIWEGWKNEGEESTGTI